jgi:hypothetical protein
MVLPIPVHQVLVSAFSSSPVEPYHSARRSLDQPSITRRKLEHAMEAATNKLKRTRLFAHLPDRAVAQLVEQPGVMIGSAGMPVPARQGDLLVILEGGLVMSRDDGEYRAAFTVAAGTREPSDPLHHPRRCPPRGRHSRAAAFLMRQSASTHFH